MEIRDPIHGSIELTPAETAVIDHPFFQRLRNIKQLGFTEFSFPGATHNRYCHSLGAMHLAGLAFDSIFQGYPFKTRENRWRFRQAVRLGALLHDVGHGPLSHTTEEVMPQVKDLKIQLYASKRQGRASHEDFTIKIITDSDLTRILKTHFTDMEPNHIAYLIDKHISTSGDSFFIDNGINFRPLLSQIVSSELDVDRMDYLARDSYYCGTSYGHVDSDWLIANLTFYENAGQLNLALNHRALYTFDDFLISRYHMYLMVYFHHKGIVYDELLLRYLKSADCDFFLPSHIADYVRYDDYLLHTHLNQSQSAWARLIADRKPYRMLYESHEGMQKEFNEIEKRLSAEKLDFIPSSSKGRLSKYYSNKNEKTLDKEDSIFVIDTDHGGPRRVSKIEESTQVFEKYETTRNISRLYVGRENYAKAQKIIEAVLS